MCIPFGSREAEEHRQNTEKEYNKKCIAMRSPKRLIAKKHSINNEHHHALSSGDG